MNKTIRSSWLAIAVIAMAPAPLYAQDAPPPAADGSLPEVEVPQPDPAAAPKPKPKPVAKKPKPKPAATPPAEPEVVAAPSADTYEAIAEISEPARILVNSPYGAAAGAGAAQRAKTGSISPINPIQALPDDLQNFTSAGTRVTAEGLAEQRPANNHEVLARVPGVVAVNDDGAARHSGIGIRGSPFRRSRKVLMMEDGLSINFSTYLDPSTHYTPPVERLESVEVLRGPVVNYGPLTNHGVINFRNLSPFGGNETVIKGGIGTTEGADLDVNNFRHVHTRQNFENWGVVASYSGGDFGGSWDNEELRYNDFYGAIGARGDNQDLTISAGYFRQRDQYDEDNFEDGDAAFFANGRNKATIFDGREDLANLSSYNADFWRLSATHNYYVDKDTTVTTRAYYQSHERNRFFFNEYEILTTDPDREPLTFNEDNFFMRGRERTYEVYGVESRAEWANRPFIMGMTQDIQAGIRYERHQFTNCNTVGTINEVLDSGNSGRCDIQSREPAGSGPFEYNLDRSRRADIEADAYSGFIQSAIHVTNTLTVTPGLRFESYDITRDSIRAEAPQENGRSTSNHDHVLPAIAMAWEAMPNTTVYAGYHQGMTPQVTRGPAFPLPDEIGNNFQIGVRSDAIRGFSFDVAYFHSRIDDYQIKEPISTPDRSNNVFGTADEVEINGVELGARLDSRPITGGPWNFFGEAIYTYADSVIVRGEDDGVDISGNIVPEVPEHFANLTVGFAHAIGFDASVTYTYRGEFFTDARNTISIPDDSTVGLVDDVWLLSARANYAIPNTNLTLWANGQNLTDEFYIAERSDGAKPGIGRTIMGGFTLRFE
jgi:Fe(3+) dicitrate transport protein